MVNAIHFLKLAGSCISTIAGLRSLLMNYFFLILLLVRYPVYIIYIIIIYFEVLSQQTAFVFADLIATICLWKNDSYALTIYRILASIFFLEYQL